jgi:hypothetical protein
MQNFQKGWQKWLAISRMAGNFLARILVSIFYFTLMLPFNIGVTYFSDPLQIKNRPLRFWLPREAQPDSLERARRQF